jgi:hypothetical protein
MHARLHGIEPTPGRSQAKQKRFVINEQNPAGNPPPFSRQVAAARLVSAEANRDT